MIACQFFVDGLNNKTVDTVLVRDIYIGKIYRYPHGLVNNKLVSKSDLRVDCLSKFLTGTVRAPDINSDLISSTE